jgi:hypothetical protein
MKDPRSKIQDPEKIQIARSSYLVRKGSNCLEASRDRREQIGSIAIGIWILELLWILDLGSWIFIPHSASRITARTSRIS